jgi:hypothetical protein
MLTLLISNPSFSSCQTTPLVEKMMHHPFTYMSLDTVEVCKHSDSVQTAALFPPFYIAG